MNSIAQLFARHLLKDIPAVSQQDRTDMVRAMLGQPGHRSQDALATSLAKSGMELGPMLSAILRCQWLYIHQLMNEINPDNADGTLRAFAQCVTHFSELQLSIVAAFEHHSHAALDEQIFERVMAQCRLQWASEQAVHLHNYFHEMPVTATANYIDSSGARLHITASEEVGRVFLCKADMLVAWISCGDKKYVLQVSIKQACGNDLTLTVQGVKEATKELRCDVRIEPAEVVPVKLNRHGMPSVAQIHDISSTGIGLVVDQAEAFIRGETLACFFQIGETKYFLEAMVQWACCADGKVRTGLKFISLGPFSEPLRKFIFAQQQLIIKQLKKLSAPGWMQ